MVNTVTQSEFALESPVRFSSKLTWKPAHTGEEKHKYAIKSGKGWVTQTINSAHDLYEHIRKGHPIAPVFDKGERQQTNFQSAQLLLLDFDEIANLGIDRAMSIPFIRDYAAILHETPKSTPEKPRLRVVFIYEKPITDAGEYVNLLKRLLLHLEVTYDLNADWSTANAAQFFFGSDKPNPVVRDRILPERVVASLIYSPEQIESLCNQRHKDTQAFEDKEGDFTPTSGAQVLIQALTPPKEVVTTPTHPVESLTLFQWRFTPESLKALEDALGVKRYNRREYAKVICPFHEDHRPSAGWNRDTRTLHCMECDKTYLAIEVAAKLGITLVSVRITPDGSLYSPPQDGVLHQPNSVREWFLQHGITHVPRLLDLLYMNGFHAHQVFCAGDILDLCKEHKINRKALQAALKQEINGHLIFTPHQSVDSSQPDNSENFCTVDSSGGSQPLSIQTSHDVNVQKGTEIAECKRGRPSQYYSLPSVNDLYGWLDVLPSFSDRLELKDLRSPAIYRKALNRKLFERRPQAYSQGWLAKRVGVKDTSTIRRQLKQMEEKEGLVKTPQFYERPITFRNLDTVPDDETAMTLDNLWLECEGADKKYPPKKSVAAWLLSKGNKVKLMSRRPNHYEINRELATQKREEKLKEAASKSPQSIALLEPATTVVIEPIVEQPSVVLPTPPEFDKPVESRMKPKDKKAVIRNGLSRRNPFSGAFNFKAKPYQDENSAEGNFAPY